MTDEPPPYLRCPHCGALFAAPASLADHGMVRCGNCLGVFAAAQHGVATLIQGLHGANQTVTAETGGQAQPETESSTLAGAQGAADAAGEQPPETARVAEPPDEPLAPPGATPEGESGDQGAVFELDGQDWGGGPGGAGESAPNSAGDDLTLDSESDPASPAIDLSGAEGFFDLDAPAAGQIGGDPADEAPAGDTGGDFDRNDPAEPTPDPVDDDALQQPAAGPDALASGPAGEAIGEEPPGGPGADAVSRADGADTAGVAPMDLPAEAAGEVPSEADDAGAPGPAIELAADIADGVQDEADIFAGIPGLREEPAPAPTEPGELAGETPAIAAAAQDKGDGQSVPADEAVAPAASTVPSASKAAGDQLPPAGGSLAGAILRLVLALLLLVALVGQGAYYWHDQLAEQPVLRPWVERFCALAGCQVTPRRDLAQLRIIARHVRSHPVYRDALVVEATLVNRAGFPQPYPNLQVRFFDANGQPVAGRVFKPSEYLRGPLVDQALLVSDVPVRAHLELKDPGPSAVEYRFEFR